MASFVPEGDQRSGLHDEGDVHRGAWHLPEVSATSTFRSSRTSQHVRLLSSPIWLGLAV